MEFPNYVPPSGPEDIYPTETLPNTPSRIVEEEGDIFKVPAGSAIIHAVNAIGKWGKGFALVCKQRYPRAFVAYTNLCEKARKQEIKTRVVKYTVETNGRELTGKEELGYPLGTALIIPPDPSSKAKHYVICLFTSTGYGKGVSPAFSVLGYTGLALLDLKRQLDMWHELEDLAQHPKPSALYSCRINSGLFRVDWQDTKRIMSHPCVGLEISVISRPVPENETREKQLRKRNLPEE